jgi:hypothetical protein
MLASIIVSTVLSLAGDVSYSYETRYDRFTDISGTTSKTALRGSDRTLFVMAVVHKASPCSSTEDRRDQGLQRRMALAAAGDQSRKAHEATRARDI